MTVALGSKEWVNIVRFSQCLVIIRIDESFSQSGAFT